ncbi:hypothetical protein T492DRAFT_949761 [Pavlovales sp. CCMP2436]|nr:hypothetical protein T492DRAFT_949761 [Pavlovales sp. CCMP2436]|mmetsp:Transcript_5183/g.13520  ORF Transcript_5183/g.13520 Transcript_5183/m.13520 type:complete len:233 (-) Transcript_5183:65-763(-)
MVALGYASAATKRSATAGALGLVNLFLTPRLAGLPGASRLAMSSSQLAEPWFAREKLTFSCTQCGGCCSGDAGLVLFSREEGSQMATRLGLSVEQFYDRHAHRVATRGTIGADKAWSLKELKSKKAGLVCTLLGKDGRTCSVYTDRPKQCSAYPIWRENVQTKESWEEMKKECPGVAAVDGKPFTTAHITRTLADLDAYWETVELEAHEDMAVAELLAQRARGRAQLGNRCP